MHAVFVSFHFLAPKRPCEKLIQAHQALLDRLDGLQSSVMLDSRSELAVLLMYDDRELIDAYFASDEFQLLSTQPGCHDVFVKEFSTVPVESPAVEHRQVLNADAMDPATTTLA